MPQAKLRQKRLDPEEQARIEQAIKRLDRYATLMDSVIRVPGTDIRFGLDALIGLIPGIGDLAGAALSGYVIAEAWRLRAPKRLLLRMLGNAAVEVVAGVVPVFGDLFDLYWKANIRNLGLLRDYLQSQLPPPEALLAQRRGWQIPGWAIVLAMVLGTLYILYLLSGAATLPIG